MALIVAFWTVSTAGYFLGSPGTGPLQNDYSVLIYTYINDFWIACVIGISIFFPFLLLNKINSKSAIIFSNIAFISAALMQMMLVAYYYSARTPLGADFLGYSSRDIFLSSINSEDFSILLVLAFLACPILMLVLEHVLIKRIANIHYRRAFFIAIVATGIFRIVMPCPSIEMGQNKIEYFVGDIIQSKINNDLIYKNSGNPDNDYPLLRPIDETKNVLGPFFTLKAEIPNLVFIVLEGFGSDFTGAGAEYPGFTPFLDSLALQSLNWKNFVCNSGRSFGVLPSLFGSLPFGTNGFLELEDFPSHLSLISILKANNFLTSYYEGSNSSFDRKLNFLEYHGIERLIDEKSYGPEYERIESNSAGFSWGYADHEIYTKALSSFNSNSNPRLDIIITQTAHEPFMFPGRSIYELKIDKFLEKSKLSNIKKSIIVSNKKIFASLKYADDALKKFMDDYKQKNEFENTIFIITGDHRLIPIPHKDVLSRFHVPFMIYSPLIKKPEQFSSVSSHLDVTPSISALLKAKYYLQMPEKIAWMGAGLDTARQFRNDHTIPLIRYKGLIQDLILDTMILSRDKIYRISKEFNAYEIDDPEKYDQIEIKLNEFRALNNYVTSENKIYPKLKNKWIESRNPLTSAQLAQVQHLTQNLEIDGIFEMARTEAFENHFEIAQLLCAFILLKNPEYIDARILKGRALAWDQQYEKAEEELTSAIQRAPYYEDGYLALLDVFWWSNQDEKAALVVSEATRIGINSAQIEFKLAKACKRMNQIDKAKSLLAGLILEYPENQEFKSFYETF